ncbi:MAG TPA: phosphopantetheine-binding protein [Kineosporiaceae bacterium]
MAQTSPPDRARIVEEIRDAVLRIVPTVSAADVRGDRHLRQLGADSVDRVEIILTVLDRLGTRVPLAAFSDLPDLDAMADLLAGRVVR